MSIALNLLQDVRWRGKAVAGDRLQALLAALAVHGCRPVPAEELIELVWGEDAPGGRAGDPGPGFQPGGRVARALASQPACA